MAETVLQSVVHPYSVKFLPPHAQISRSVQVTTVDQVCLTQPTISEVHPAFRITRKPQHSHPLPVHEHEYEVINFDNQLWWPVADRDGPIRVREFRIGLQMGDPRSLQYILGKSVAADELRIRDTNIDPSKIESSSKDEVRAAMHKRAAETLLYGDFVFRKGGEPVYAYQITDLPFIDKMHHYIHGSLPAAPNTYLEHRWGLIPTSGDICVVDPMSRHGLPSFAVGYFDPQKFESCIYYGMVFRADEPDAVQIGADELSEMPNTEIIKVCDGTPVTTDVIELQLDHCVKILDRLFQNRRLSAEISQYRSLEPIVSKLQDLTWKLNITKENKINAIDAFRNWCARGNISPGSLLHYVCGASERAIYEINRNCRRRGLQPLFKLDEDIDDALANISPR